jgi:4-hydroxy-3-methylbut-2-enyl diphosphate reductase
VTVEVDKESGFCPGVVSAIRKAEGELKTRRTLYCLGDIVHNSMEVRRLEELGLVTIRKEDLEGLSDTKVLLRAHGEPPATYQLAASRGIEIVDATCPVVLQLQKKIRRMYEAEPDSQIVIFGKHGHAEVVGLVGQTDNTAIVVEHDDELDKIDYARPVRLFSQTTMSVEQFRQLCVEVGRRMKNPSDLQTYDTICRQVANRIPHMRAFAMRHDVVLFVSGRKSSNGKALFEVCQSANPRSYFVSQPDEVSADMVQGAESIGVCGATSTPRWQMEQVASRVAEWSGKNEC